MRSVSFLFPLALLYTAHALSSIDRPGGIRLNKVFKATYSRRQADALIESGRVSVNGRPVDSKGGFLDVPYVDEIQLDGKTIEGWEEMNRIHQQQEGDGRETKANLAQTSLEYVKYWKPIGVTCTTDPQIAGNIIKEIQRDGYNPKHRVFPVGRLDKSTSGIILLTSDGQLVNSALRSKHKRPKVYEVGVDRPIRSADLDRWRNGVVITTETVRNGVRKDTTAKTLPCEVEALDDYWLQMTLVEGRNRQVRKMTAALNYETIELHRVEFMGINLNSLEGPGDWAPLDKEEMKIVSDVLREAEGSN